MSLFLVSFVAQASLFASELLDCYERTAKQYGFQCESLSVSRTDVGGIREGTLSITGGSSNSSGGGGSNYSSSMELMGPYGMLKFESGVHRVQRVPVNDPRIHTSTASVAVLPTSSSGNSGTSSSTALPLSELRIETYRASGAGGQHVNTTDSAVRITHIPTGMTIAMQDQRSQHKNKAKALHIIEARVADQKRMAEIQQRGQVRRTLMGGGTRSERIRTYNFPQDRVTDHRAGVTEYGIEGLLSAADENGLVAVFAPALRRLWTEQLLKELEEQDQDAQDRANSTKKKTIKGRKRGRP